MCLRQCRTTEILSGLIDDTSMKSRKQQKINNFTGFFDQTFPFKKVIPLFVKKT